jgi:hypothetical protein
MKFYQTLGPNFSMPSKNMRIVLTVHANTNAVLL